MVPCLATVVKNIVRPPPSDHLPVIHVIFGGDKPRHTPSQRCVYYKESYRDRIRMEVNLIKASRSHPRNSLIPITFTEDEAK